MTVISRYVTPRPPRHRIVHDGSGEHLVVPARRNWFALPFLCVWISFWTMGGMMAFTELLRTGEAFLAIWLIGWAVAWLFAAASILWQLAGREEIAVVVGDLLLRLRAGPFPRARAYRGGDVRNLRTSVQTIFERSQAGFAPFVSRMGAVKFDHGARMIGFAGGVDEAEAAIIRDWLVKRLPRAAT
ncbi:MAG: hypothetical protein PGN21_12555 [Sphingomonas paucimobilis]